jgi:2',3'-cyclic-nucleotide 2'-phosphodiesterase (5'-nucleotidase family)
MMRVCIPGIIFISVLFFSCTSPVQLTKVETSEYVFSDSSDIKADSAITAEIRPYSDKLRADMGVVLAKSIRPLEKGNPEGVLGDFVADLCFERTLRDYKSADQHPPDFAFFNNGGLRKALPAGEITKGDVFELMPFENELVILTLNGSSVKKLINFMASKGGAPVSGIRFKIKDKEAREIIIGTAAFDSTKRYKVVTSDYLANGGDNFSFLSEAINRESINLKMRDAIIQHLYILGKTEEVVDVKPDGRISNE